MNRKYLMLLVFVALLTNTYAQKPSSIKIPTDSEEIEVEPFTRIRLKSQATVHLIQQEGPQQVFIQAAPEVLEKVVTEVYKETLNLDIQPKSRFSMPPNATTTYWIFTEDLEALEVFSSGRILADAPIHTLESFQLNVSGSGSIELNALHSPNFKADVQGSGFILVEELEADKSQLQLSGSGRMDIAGTTPTAELTLRGTGVIETTFLEATECIATLRGGGNLFCYPLKKLTATLSGTGFIHYRGTPTLNLKTGNKKQLKPIQTLPPRKSRIQP